MAVAVVVVFCDVAVLLFCFCFCFFLFFNFVEHSVSSLPFAKAPSLCEAEGFPPRSQESSVPDHSVRVRSDRFQIPVSGFVHPRSAQMRGTVFQKLRRMFHQEVMFGPEGDAHSVQVPDVVLDGIDVGLMCWCYS